MRIRVSVCAAALIGLLSMVPAYANPTIDELLQRHAELTVRLDELDASVRARVRRDLLDQIEGWRSGLEEFDSEEYRLRLAQALETAASYGMDAERLQRLYDASRQILLRADFSAQSPTAPASSSGRLSQFLNWAGEEEARLAELAAASQQHRVELHRKLALAYLEALLERDPAVAAANFRRYADALRTIASAEADILASEAEALAADLRVVQDIVVGIPLVGEAMDIVALVEGSEPLTGNKLEGLDWALTLLGVAAGPVDQLIRRVPLAQQVIDEAVLIAREMIEPLVATGRYSKDQLTAFVKRFGRGGEATLAGARAQSRLELAVISDQAIARLNQTPQGQLAARAWQEANAAGAAKVSAATPHFQALTVRAAGNADELRWLVSRGTNQVVPDAEWVELTQAYIALRQDKRAIGVLKDADERLRQQVFDFEQALFGTVEMRNGVALNLGDGIVDYQTMSGMNRGLSQGLTGSRFARAEDVAGAEQVQTWLRRYAAQMGDTDFQIERYIDPHNPQFEVFNATNSPPRRGDIGADRDITYRLVLFDGHRIDVPAEFVEPHYHSALYHTLNGLGESTPQQRREFATLMDHAVTDGYVPEAYRPGMDVGDFLGSPTVRVSAAGAEDLASTIAYKGQEWFERGQMALAGGQALRGWTDIAEGMRQMTKQYDNQIMARLSARGLNETANVPPQLGSAIDIMKRVTYPGEKLPLGAAPLNPAEAEAAIKAIGFSDLDDVATQLGLFFEALEKSRPGGGL